MKYLLHVIVLLFAIYSCQSEKNKKEYPVKTISFDLDKKMEYSFLDILVIDTIIHLETNDSVLIAAIQKLYFTNDYISLSSD